MDPIPQDTFDNIALALSGGGFRAAAFGLGTMDYLHRVSWQGKSLLERVSFISSTSGGSITLAFYTSRLYQGQEIAAILRDLYAVLQGDHLLKSAMERLADPVVWRDYPHKQRNLINAFAITYDRELYQGLTLRSFWHPQGDPHIQEVAINSTELNNGLSFRFKLSRHDQHVQSFGNSYLHFKPDAMWAIQSLRVGDVVAASSCFPLGFEPIIFPHDFTTGEHKPEELLGAMDILHNNPIDQKLVDNQPFGLIDGGVVDNQGIYSLELEDASRFVALENHHRSKKQVPNDVEKPFSLLIISDVASYFLSPYQIPKPLGGLLGKIPLVAVLPGLVLGAIMPILATIIYAREGASWYNYILLLPGYVLSWLIFGLFAQVIKRLHDPAQPTAVRSLRKHLYKILRLPLKWWWQAVQTRSLSFRMLAQDVFLKQIRRMHQRQAYEDRRNQLRLLSNFIYDLSQAQHNRREFDAAKKDVAWWSHYQDRLRPSKAVEAMAEAARNVGTTLWFDPKRPQDLDHVVATAQFTTCFNLIRHLNRLEAASKQPLASDLEGLRQQLLADWARFQREPGWMVGELFIRNGGD